MGGIIKAMSEFRPLTSLTSLFARQVRQFVCRRRLRGKDNESYLGVKNQLHIRFLIAANISHGGGPVH